MQGSVSVREGNMPRTQVLLRGLDLTCVPSEPAAGRLKGGFQPSQGMQQCVDVGSFQAGAFRGTG